MEKIYNIIDIYSPRIQQAVVQLMVAELYRQPKVKHQQMSFTRITKSKIKILSSNGFIRLIMMNQ